MAYSDYGGYAYRNGVRVVERSDATITPEGDVYGTPGCYPGFALLAEGMPADEVKKRIEWPSGHVVLGDGPIYVVLYKQTYLRVFRACEEIPLLDIVKCADEKAIRGRYLDYYCFAKSGDPCFFAIDGCRITVYWREEDNYYQYVMLEQPDGNVWCGWSGYGVGAGLEDCGYGYSTEEREECLWELFPQKESTSP